MRQQFISIGMRQFLRASLLLLALLAAVSPSSPALSAQERKEAKPAGEETAKKESSETEGKTESEKEGEKEPVHAIVGGTVLPVSGPPIHRGTILFQKGKILAVGSEITVPDDAVVHKVDGFYVSPGFVAVEASVSNARGSGGGFEDSLDPYDRDLHIALANGITTMQVVQSFFFGFFRGGAPPVRGGKGNAIIKSTLRDLDGMFLKEPASIYFSFRQSMASIFDLRDKFERASKYLKEREEAVKAKKKPPKMPRDLSVHVQILEGDVPTFCRVDSVEAMRLLLDLRRKYQFDLVISGAADGWKITRELASLDVPVILKSHGPDFNFDMDSAVLGEGDMIAIRLPGVLAAGGVRVGLLPYQRRISLDGLAGRDLSALNMDAAFAVRGDMDEATALRAITLEPARILRIDDRVGSLEKGKDADILVWKGHPLHYRSFVETAWINGKIYYEREKSRLYRHISHER